MAINIQTLLDVINAKITTGVASGSTDSDRLAELTAWRDNHQNAGFFNTFADLPTADSANAGNFFSVGTGSSKKYYVSWKNKWKEVLSTDSDAVGNQTLPNSVGQTYGFAAAGIIEPAPDASHETTIDRFPFASDANATDVGDLGPPGGASNGSMNGDVGSASSDDRGWIFSSGGMNFTFANSNLSGSNPYSTGLFSTQGGQSETHLYAMGGRPSSLPTAPGDTTAVKMQFSNTTPTTLTSFSQARSKAVTVSSPAAVYTSGGYRSYHPNDIPPAPGPQVNSTGTEKHLFSNDNLSTVNSVGTNSPASSIHQSMQTEVVGYIGSGSTLKKFPFASETPVSVGPQTMPSPSGLNGENSAASSSANYGYRFGGGPPSSYSAIVKFPWNSEATVTSVGNLTSSRSRGSGHQD